jgi:amidase
LNERIEDSARRLARSIREGEVSARDAAEACLRRIDEVNPRLNAVVQLRREQALREAEAADAATRHGKTLGPLHGVPITVKDSLDTQGLITTWGTGGRAAFVPGVDATVVARMKGAGAILLGKTNTPELTLSFDTENAIYGRTVNPYDLSRSPGGSSGGSAAIVAAGGSPIELGSDTGGSIRLPAHFCGVAGLRPTSGRVPRTGHAVGPGGLLDSLTQIGPLARFVEDLGLVLPIIAGPDPGDPSIAPVPLRDPDAVDVGRLRIALHTDNGIQAARADVAQATIGAAKVLSDQGAKVEETRPPGIEEAGEIFSGLLSADGGAWARHILERAGTALGDSSLEWLVRSPALSADDLARLLQRWDAFRVRMLRFLERFDLILCPPNANPALAYGEWAAHIGGYSYTMPANLAGLPAAVVRAGASTEGLPVGVQIVGRPWREDVALAAAARVESALGGFRPPPL